MRILNLLALTTALCLPFAVPALAEGPATISVTGEGTVSSAPDLATISLGVTTTADTAAAAMAANSQALTAVLDRLKPGEHLDFPDLIKQLLAAGRNVASYPFEGYWLDIGRPDDYATAIDEFESRRDEFLPGERPQVVAMPPPPPEGVESSGKATSTQEATR